MNTEKLLTEFRSEVPLPVEATARRIYAQATSRRRPLSRSRLALAVLVAAAGVAGGLFATLGGGTTAPPAGQGRGDQFFVPVENVSFTRDGQTVTSIAFTVRDPHYANATLALQVLRADAPPVIGYNVNAEPVFDERVPMTSTGSTIPDTAVSTVSATLSPDTWKDGCQDAYYRVEAAVYAADSPAEPFSSIYGDHFYITGWFRCSGG